MTDGTRDRTFSRESPAEEEEAAQTLVKVFARLSEVRSQLALVERPKGGSSLYGDDRRSPKYVPSVTALHSLSGAVSCLEELQQLMMVETDDAMSLTSRPYGQIALIRQALDMAAVSGWLLSPVSRDERVRRVFIFENENTRLSHNTQLSFGMQPERRLAERYAPLQDAADEAGQTALPIAARETSMPKTTAMLTEIEQSQ